MNEQLVVKNFGPIKEATVDFKRVTVFIGPTGGGKSTLAKLAAIFKSWDLIASQTTKQTRAIFEDYLIADYFKKSSTVSFVDKEDDEEESRLSVDRSFKITHPADEEFTGLIGEVRSQHALLVKKKKDFEDVINNVKNVNPRSLDSLALKLWSALMDPSVHYIPAERLFIPALEYSWAGLLRDNIGLPKQVLNFANAFSLSRQENHKFSFEFLGVKYVHRNGQDFVRVHKDRKLFRLRETASGIQSVTPLLVLLEHLSRNTEQAQSFIIEEPELNLYPTAQQGLLNWLVEKCTKGENDLTITTHSPYLLAHLNTLLFAYQVAEAHPDRADDVAKVVPRESWINPKEFAAYHVEGQQENGVRSIISAETELISYNQLDALAGLNAEDFEKLLDINAGLEVE